MAKSPREKHPDDDDDDVELKEKKAPEPPPTEPPTPEPTTAKTIEEHGIDAGTPYPTGGNKDG